MKTQLTVISFVTALVLSACADDESESTDTTGAITTEQTTTPTPDSVDTTTPPEATATDATPTATSTTTTSKPEPPPTAADPMTTTSAADVTTTVEPTESAAMWSTDCTGEPFDPPFLRNGEPVGEPALADLGDPEADDDQPVAIWAQGTDLEVTQLLDSDQDDGFATVSSFDEVLAAGQYEAAVVPLGPPTAPISIDIRDAERTCTRQYSVAAAFTEDEATSYAAAWIEALNRPTTGADPSTADGSTNLISETPCGDPVPIDSMPDGQPTTEPLIEGDEVRWSSGDASRAGDNVVIQRLVQPSADEIASARASDIEFTDGPLTVSVVLSESVSDGNGLFVFDEGSDCVRVVNTDPFVGDDVIAEYARSLLASWTEA